MFSVRLALLLTILSVGVPVISTQENPQNPIVSLYASIMNTAIDAYKSHFGSPPPKCFVTNSAIDCFLNVRKNTLTKAESLTNASQEFQQVFCQAKRELKNCSRPYIKECSRLNRILRYIMHQAFQVTCSLHGYQRYMCLEMIAMPAKECAKTVATHTLSSNFGVALDQYVDCLLLAANISCTNISLGNFISDLHSMYKPKKIVASVLFNSTLNNATQESLNEAKNLSFFDAGTGQLTAIEKLAVNSLQVTIEVGPTTTSAESPTTSTADPMKTFTVDSIRTSSESPRISTESSMSTSTDSTITASTKTTTTSTESQSRTTTDSSERTSTTWMTTHSSDVSTQKVYQPSFIEQSAIKFQETQSTTTLSPPASTTSITTTTDTATAPSLPPFQCYGCSSGAPGYWQHSDCPPNGLLQGWATQTKTCNGPCVQIVSRWPLGDVVRSCSKNYYFSFESPPSGCRTNNDDVVCFCSSDRCNTFNMTEQQAEMIKKFNQ
ncbi:flocculation protein FLO11 [Biomphalaria pfeifferi]|uniref:Flocculation protein FLO11 n=1 Tax=Biomphalaria pfeifferi TaxID=112525 RepID=A0AAD8B0H5_BIOPF|nr:flocculation protein FLO11 [Biomphalaria pfeifferi]